MHNPNFLINNFGAFDYYLSKTPCDPKNVHRVSIYEFEFYTEKRPGGLHIDGVFYPSSRGGCVLTKPGQMQGVESPYKGYYLNIVTQDPELCDMLDHLPTSFTIWNMGQIVKLIQKMIATEEQDSLAGRMLLQSYACRILSQLSQYRSNPNSSALQHQKMLLKVDQYIREHLSEELPLAKLAKVCNLDATYFHKMYTAAFGCTPAQRILGFRIAAAKTGLIESKISLSELADRCGFSSQTYFCYKFKQVTGLTPMQYRNAILSRPKN